MPTCHLCPKCGTQLEVKEVSKPTDEIIRYICLGCKSSYKRIIKKTRDGFLYSPIKK